MKETNSPQSKPHQLVYKTKSSLQQKKPVEERTIIPYFSLYTNKIVIAPRAYGLFKNHRIHEKSLNNLKK